MAKAKAKAQAKAAAASRHRPARQTDAERMNRILIVGGVVAVILVALGVIGFGWYQTQVRPLNKTVLAVGDMKFSLGNLVRRMKLEKSQSPVYQQGGQALLDLPTSALDQMEREAKIVAGAAELSVTVTDEDVAKDIRDRGSLADDAEASLFASELRNQVKDSGLTKDEYLLMLRAEVTEEKVRNYFVFLAPTSEPQIRAQYMILTDEQATTDALNRVRNGEDFKAVSDEVSLSLSSSSTPAGGEVDWAVRGGTSLLPRAAQDWLFDTAQPGQVSDIINSANSNLFYVVKLLERDPDRALDEDQRRIAGNRNLGDWLVSLDSTLNVKRDLTREDEVRALNKVI